MKKVISLWFAALAAIMCGCAGGYETERAASVYVVSSNITVCMTDPGNDKAADEVRHQIISRIESQNVAVPLDVCIYGLDDEQIISALEQAISAGVHVRFAGNADGSKRLSSDGYYYDGYRRIASALDSRFPLECGSRRLCSRYSKFSDFALVNPSGIMHNKFMIFTDADGRRTVLCGSMNFTSSCIGQNNNDIIFIRNNAVAAKYERYFESLIAKSDVSEEFQTFRVDGIDIGVGFSRPSSKSSLLTDCIIAAGADGKSSIDFMIFTMTSLPIFDMIIERAETGLEVRGLFDRAQMRSSREELLINTDAQCRFDGNEYVQNGHGGKLHHKCMIIDADTDAPAVITGSFNWTANADKQNNENLLIIRSYKIAEFYKQHFEQEWQDGTKITY